MILDLKKKKKKGYIHIPHYALVLHLGRTIPRLGAIKWDLWVAAAVYLMAVRCFEGNPRAFIHHNYSFQAAWRLQLGQFRRDAILIMTGMIYTSPQFYHNGSNWFCPFSAREGLQDGLRPADGSVTLWIFCRCPAFSQGLQTGGQTVSDFNKCMRSWKQGARVCNLINIHPNPTQHPLLVLSLWGLS